MNLDQITNEVKLRRRSLDRRIGEQTSLVNRKELLHSEIKELKKNVLLYEKVSIILNSIAEDRQITVQRQIESLVTRGLQTVFDDNQLSFHMNQTVKGRRPDVEFIVRTTLDDGRTIDTDVMSARGGGVASVVGFLLRLVVLLLSKKDKDSIIVLDESFSHLSDDYVPIMAEFLKELVDKTGVQIILITHQKEFTSSADVVYNLSIKNGQTIVEEWGQ